MRCHMHTTGVGTCALCINRSLDFAERQHDLRSRVARLDDSLRWRFAQVPIDSARERCECSPASQRAHGSRIAGEDSTRKESRRNGVCDVVLRPVLLSDVSRMTRATGKTHTLDAALYARVQRADLGEAFTAAEHVPPHLLHDEYCLRFCALVGELRRGSGQGVLVRKSSGHEREETTESETGSSGQDDLERA